MKPHIDPKVDYAFKRVFGSEGNVPVLIDLLNAVLTSTLPQPITALTIANPFNPKISANDKLSVVDIKAYDESGRAYNVEMQMMAVRSYPGRVLYYWARLTRPTKVRFQKSGMGKTKVSQGEIAPAGTFVGRVKIIRRADV